jgi:(p)ppGpp synthase/HD superfamily hydrolase
MNHLQRALEIAITAHAGQKQKNGEPYALHPIRLALTLQDEPERIAAVLHDVVEDTFITLTALIDEGFSPEVIEAVRLLTKPKGADYDQYIVAIAANPIARAVKLADLRDNMDMTRITEPLSAKDIARIQKYHRAWTCLK